MCLSIRHIIHTFLQIPFRGFRRVFLPFWGCLLGAWLFLSLPLSAVVHHVAPEGNPSGAWADAITLQEALAQAQPGDEIWVQGFETLTGKQQVYTAPEEGFTLRSGVKLYGGFRGNETNLNQRPVGDKAFEFTCRSVLSGDVLGNDSVAAGLIYPGNPLRADNAVHVLTIDLSSANPGNQTTELDGFTVYGGHAEGQQGGGVYVSGGAEGRKYVISRCFFHNNYAERGGAVYVAGTVAAPVADRSYLSQCMVYNNAAGRQVDELAAGGGVYLEGYGEVVNCVVANNENSGVHLSDGCRVLNSTVVRNTGGGIGMDADYAGTPNVLNTVVWGNNALYSQHTPSFSYSAFPECEENDPNGNIRINTENLNANGFSAFFRSPSTGAGYDRTFAPRNMAYPLWDWSLREGSALIDRGDDNYYTLDNFYGDADFAGQTRLQGTIDIGAYEYQPMPAGRVLRVKARASAAGADGLTWETAYPNVQDAINALYGSGGQGAGEVWVAAGDYAPTELLVPGEAATAAFIMRDGISVYGGFAGTETARAERTKSGDMPWQYEHTTRLIGSGYSENLEWNATDHRWTLNSRSNHVVWFADADGQTAFGQETVLDGVTIMGGQASTASSGAAWMGDRGAGVYMHNTNARLTNCVVTENVSGNHAGGVWLSGGRMIGCLVYNNGSEQAGGGVYVDNSGLVLHSMLANNSAASGAGIYLRGGDPQADGQVHPEYLILSTSIVTNNTARANAAVYCDGGGVLLQNTINNNAAPRATDESDPDATRTGGLFIDGYALVVNSTLWNNRAGDANTQRVPMYARNASADKVRFMNSALSGMNNAVWNDVLQQDLIELAQSNTGAESEWNPEYAPAGKMPTDDALNNTIGVQSGWTATETGHGIDYFWPNVQGANLRAQGLPLGAMPAEVLIAPELDICGNIFAAKPAVGAYAIEPVALQPEDTGSALRLYVDAECTEPDHKGQSWDMAYRSLNEAIAYFASLPDTTVAGKTLEIHVLEGECYPTYAFTGSDPREATVLIRRMPGGVPLHIYGGYSRDNRTAPVRSPLTYRTLLNGNPDGGADDALYHILTVEAEAKVVLDGFHVLNGHASSETSRLYGAGMLVHDGAEVTMRNCVFEHNTATEGAAIDARNATLILENCVVNNNTNADADKPVVNASILTLTHVTVVNNEGAAWTTDATVRNTFSAGNTPGNTQSLASTGAEGAVNFANPTNEAGAGAAAYLGGYADFTPLTSSVAAASLINKGTAGSNDPATDIAGRGRNLGGTPDLGAYEADLPENGTVLYVTATGSGDFSGSSWENAIAGNMIYDLESSATDKRVLEGGTGVPTTDNRYIGFYDDGNIYGETSGASKLFFDGLTGQNEAATNVNYTFETHDGERRVTGDNGTNIRNRRYERYISGLQYAVEMASQEAAEAGEDMQVWVAGGTYTDYKGFVIRDRVNVLGGFPNVGTPGEDDRYPLLSTSIPANAAAADLDRSLYETIIQIQETAPVTWNGNSPTVVGGLPSNTRKPVLFQPDVCLPTLSPSGRNADFQAWNWAWTGLLWYYEWREKNDKVNDALSGGDDTSNTYRYNLPANQQRGIYEEYHGAVWDGFTIRHGFITDYEANRDGGAGVRMFRGVTLRNCVVQDNYNRSSCSRGAGIYCDGDNSSVINCFVLNNYLAGGESFGGGIYMILGTGYNNLVANNYADEDGGGIFIEAATFYNNSIVYNNAGHAAGGLYQYTGEGYGSSSLQLYNCLFYGNGKAAMGFANESKFNGAWNCYIQSEQAFSVSNGKLVDCQWLNGEAPTAANSPFESTNAQAENDYRLKFDTWCVNHGTEVIGNVILPETDVDFTDRIKDCTVDVGAYERDNTENIAPDASRIYYVTEVGAGLANGSSPDNAACEMKLQAVLTHAGQQAATTTGLTYTVRVAEGSYEANTLSDPNDPQSYTYEIPRGVTLEGGWDEAFTVRKPLEQITKLIPQGSEGGQTVTGYHAVSFPDEGSTTAQAVVDGCHLEGGQATATSGNDNSRGGGAIVPAWGHVRNCVVHGNEAVYGGGLYLRAGATVSGTVVWDNTARYGGGLCANAESASADSRAHVISCTVVRNHATTSGGGAYHGDGAAMVLNSVVWGNTAPSDNNVSGVFNVSFADTALAAILGRTSFTPYNYSFIETYNMPATYYNTFMESDNRYFTNEETWQLRAYSELIDHGIDTLALAGLTERFALAEADMAGLSRKQPGVDKADVGAFAFESELDVSTYIPYLFVASAEELVTDGTLTGRSFYTPLTWLDDALEYIAQYREEHPGDSLPFSIFVAGGTYTPHYRRADAPEDDDSRRYNSFTVPPGVSIYGGFSGTERWSCGLKNEVQGVTLTPLDGDGSNLPAFLAEREGSDLNSNGVTEAYEFAHQTTLSGLLTASESGERAYHVLYSDAAGAANPQPVLLDGLTILNGETSNTLTPVANRDDAGRGGGVYSNGVPYIINRCRLTGNKAVRGGAVYMRDAELRTYSSLYAGNSTVDNPQAPGMESYGVRGGAVYLGGMQAVTALYAANCIWANNETTGWGAAIATNFVDGTTTYVDPNINLMNCLLVRNKAEGNAAIFNQNAKSQVRNTVVWGNENELTQYPDVAAVVSLRYCATDYSLPESGNGNVTLSTDNASVSGPRFAAPSSVAGIAGNSSTACWNPGAISVLTDAGNGTLAAGESDMTRATGAYREWMTAYAADYETQYMFDGGYARYAGGKDEEGNPLDKVIDLGVYEYQYPGRFDEMDDIYVATEESGLADGSSWSNATSDLRGAMIGLARSIGDHPVKHIYIKAGEYVDHRLSSADNKAYYLTMATKDDDTGSELSTDTLIIQGSFNAAGVQDFSQPTVIGVSPEATNTTLLLDVQTNGKAVRIEGLTFDGTNAGGTAANGLVAEVNNHEDVSRTEGQLHLKNVAFRHHNIGLQVTNEKGTNGTLLVNALMAGNDTGLVADQHTTVVNATLADNVFAVTGTPVVYNSVYWNNGDAPASTTEDENSHNVMFAAEQENADVLNGPNFMDPQAGDYRLRPGYLLNRGSSDLYKQHAGIDPLTDVDLTNGARVVDGQIDLGAYEYDAPLQPIVYVDQTVAGGTGDGSSWANALTDLQSAVDLASLYAALNAGETGYVFADNALAAGRVNLSLDRVKVYGGMDGEMASSELSVTEQVAELLAGRTPLAQAVRRSKITDLTLAAAGVVDGFEVETATLSASSALLSTSMVGNIDGNANGVLYNSYLTGQATGTGEAVNVTLGDGVTLPDTWTKTHVAEDVPDNAYVSEPLWCKQLMETSDLIDKGGEASSVQEYMDRAGHAQDISGTPRVWNEKVDYGCFETWNITSDTAIPTTGGALPGNRHVVYVRAGKELALDAAAYPATVAFTPGFLLLEHGAGLRGNGHQVQLAHFAQERCLDAAGRDMAVIPFVVDSLTLNGAALPATGGTLARYRYQGDLRARYDYKFVADGDNTTWELLPAADSRTNLTEGWLLEGMPGDTVRFYGTEYAEGGEAKHILLPQHNYSEPWSGDDATGNRFTHAENMGWNLFGSPFLCAMNFEDMEYGRVVYPYDYADEAQGGDYGVPMQTWNVEGHIAAGSAVFTQTATLRDREDVAVQPRTEAVQEVSAYYGNLAVEFAQAGGDEADMILLTAVPSVEAKSTYDVQGDGVKMQSLRDGSPRIYMLRDGGRYSLLSAVDREGSVDVGVYAGEAGRFEFRIPADCDTYDYEAVMLKDAGLDRMVDLKETSYRVDLSGAGEVNDRFSIVFRKQGDGLEAAGMTMYVPGEGLLVVGGLEAGSTLRVYNATGMLVEQRTTAFSEERFQLRPDETYLVEVLSPSAAEPQVGKVVVR